jgi:hypothetical protein
LSCQPCMPGHWSSCVYAAQHSTEGISMRPAWEWQAMRHSPPPHSEAAVPGGLYYPQTQYTRLVCHWCSHTAPHLWQPGVTAALELISQAATPEAMSSSGLRAAHPPTMSVPPPRAPGPLTAVHPGALVPCWSRIACSTDATNRLRVRAVLQASSCDTLVGSSPGHLLIQHPSNAQQGPAAHLVPALHREHQRL